MPEYSTGNDCGWPKCSTNQRAVPKNVSLKDGLKGSSVESNAKIGANTTILPEVELEKIVLSEPALW